MLAGLIFVIPAPALAVEGCPDGTAASETITCTADDADGVDGEGGDDTITVNGGANVGYINGDDSTNSTNVAGADTISNAGMAIDIYGENVHTGNGAADTISNSGIMGTIYGEIVYSGNGGDDTLTNSGTAESINGDQVSIGNGGADTITNSGTVDGIVGDSVGNGNGGDDTITNTGTANDIYGDNVTTGNGGDDTITNSGTVGNIHGEYIRISGEGGDDTITNSGTVTNDIQGNGGDDTVILDGSDVQVGGTIDGGETNETNGDTLNFNMSTSDQDEFDSASAAIETAIGNGHADGNFAWHGGTITWANFEALLNNLIGPAAPAAEPAPTDDPSADSGGGTTTVYSDGNVSVSQDGDSGTLYFYGENGATDHLIASVSQSEYSGAGAGQVLVTSIDFELGVLLYVQSLGNGQFVVQYYSTADGSLLSSTVITV